MLLNPARIMVGLTRRYSGVCGYFRKASCHAPSSSGGSVPTIGCHSTIDRPEWVRRVTPPTTTIANTSAQQASSQAATARSLSRAGAGLGGDASAYCMRVILACAGGPLMHREHRGAADAALAHARERLVRPLEGKNLDRGPDRYLGSEREKFLAIAAREIGDRHDAALAPQDLVRKRRDLAHVDARARRAGATCLGPRAASRAFSHPFGAARAQGIVDSATGCPGEHGLK